MASVLVCMIMIIYPSICCGCIKQAVSWPHGLQVQSMGTVFIHLYMLEYVCVLWSAACSGSSVLVGLNLVWNWRRNMTRSCTSAFTDFAGRLSVWSALCVPALAQVPHSFHPSYDNYNWQFRCMVKYLLNSIDLRPSMNRSSAAVSISLSWVMRWKLKYWLNQSCSSGLTTWLTAMPQWQSVEAHYLLIGTSDLWLSKLERQISVSLCYKVYLGQVQ